MIPETVRLFIVGSPFSFSGSEDWIGGVTHVFGPKRLTADLPEMLSAEFLTWEDDGFSVGMTHLEQVMGVSGSRILLLASGDPLFFGLAAPLIRKYGADIVMVSSGISSVQLAAAAVKRPWSRCDLLSCHTGGRVPSRRILNAPNGAIVLGGGNGFSAPEIAQTLIRDFSFATTRYGAVFCNLGMPDAVVEEGTLEVLGGYNVNGLSILWVYPPLGALMCPGLALGLQDDTFLHQKAMITHPEVRAVVLSKLKLRPGVMWDVGAGSGSVGIEAALLVPGLTVYAFEKDPQRCAMIAENAKVLGADVNVVQGDAIYAIDSVPDPDMVFLGGGGSAAAVLTETSLARLSVGGRVCAAAVLVETAAALSGVAPMMREAVVTLQVSRSETLPTGGTLMRAGNPVTLFCWEKRPKDDLLNSF